MSVSAPSTGGIAPDTPLIELPALLAENNMHPVHVGSGHECFGLLDVQAMTAALAHVLPSRSDCSVLVVSCDATDYAASRVAAAVEDVNAHIIDLLTYPEGEQLHVMLRITHADPTAAMRSLERYGYTVVSAHGATNAAEEVSRRRIDELVQYLNI